MVGGMLEFYDFEFLGFGGGRHILNFRGEGACSMLKLEVYFLGGDQFILRPFSHFEMQYFKNLKDFCLHFQYSDFQI